MNAPTVGGPAPWSQRMRGYFLAMAFTTGIFAAIDRQLVGVLLQSIKTDLHASDTQMGLLTGTYFSLFQVIAIFPLARIADYGNRKNLIALTIGAWSLATMLCGLAQNYTQIAIAICLVAIGEAGSGPAGASLITDIFPPKTRTRVFGLLASGGAAGIAFGVFLGGTLNDLLGWRHVFLVVGAPGVAFALLYFLTIKEPARLGAPHVGARPSVFRSLATFWKIPTYRLLLFFNLMAPITGFATLSWTPAFLMRVHHLTGRQVGLFMALAIIFGSVLGNLFSGFVGDHLQKRSPRWLLYVSGGGILLAPPLVMVIVFNPSVAVVLGALGAFMFVAATYTPCNSAAAMSVAPPRSRALAQAIATLFTTIGAAIGPLYVGMMNDRLTPQYGAEAIRISMATVALPALLAGLAALLFAGLIDKDIERAV